MAVGSYELWDAVSRLADIWRESPRVGEFRNGFPECHPVTTSSSESPHLAAMVHDLRASMQSVLNPMVMRTRLEFLEAHADQVGGQVDFTRSDYLRWKEAALAVEVAFSFTLGWARSRLPGYPLLRVPHLVRDTAYTSRGFTYNYPWQREVASGGLQFLAAPPNVAKVLNLPTTVEIDLARAAQRVANAVMSSGEWGAFDAANVALDSHASDELRAARRRASEMLTAEKVDAHEPSNVMRRVAYRRDVVETVVRELRGPARVYADAFSALNSLLDTAVGDVFGAILVTPDLQHVEASDFHVLGDDVGHVGFDAIGGETFLLHLGQIVMPEGAVIDDAVLIDRTNMSFDNATGLRVRVEGRPLAGSRSVWGGQ